MAIYYDFDNMDLGNSRLRAQYVLRYAIKLVLVAYRAVSETSRSSGAEIQQRLATTVAELIETDEEVTAAPTLFKEELKAHSSLLSSTAKERENMWKRALGYKKDIKTWNSKAPSAKEVPSGVAEPVEWRLLKLRQRLFVEKNPDKTEDDMPSYYQPSIVWPAYASLELINDHKFNLVDKDSDDEPSKSSTKSRTQQRNDARPTKIAKVAPNAIVSSMVIQRHQQRNAQVLISQKDRELQKNQAQDLFQSSISALNAARDGAFDVLSPTSKADILRQAGVGTRAALQSMEEMVKNPYNRKYAEVLSDDDDDDSSGRVPQARKGLLLDSPDSDI